MGSTSSKTHPTTLSQAEIDEALGYLHATRDRVIEIVNGLSDTQWTFKPSADCWCIAENVEHVVITENSFLQDIASRLRDAPAPPADRDPQKGDRRCRAAVANRTTKVKAPAGILPAGGCTREDALSRFAGVRSQTIALLQSPDLHHRQRAINHPILGPVDAYQWVLIMAAHTERHLNQILELKARADFPKP